jgi:hypothetical protein
MGSSHKGKCKFLLSCEDFSYNNSLAMSIDISGRFDLLRENNGIELEIKAERIRSGTVMKTAGKEIGFP